MLKPMDNLTVFEEFHRIVNENEDPRTKDWYLMASPIPTVVLSVIFYISVTIFIPGYMKHRKPFQFQNFVILYNGFQVLYSGWLVYAFFVGGWSSPHYNGKCFYPGKGQNLSTASYVYFISKFTEFADTILFALRKKDNQITTLHLYHHATMPLGAWLCVKYAPDSPMTFLGFLNSFIHVIMYSYYMLSAMGPKIQKYLWWKKYITLLQLGQFVMTLSQSLLTLLYGCSMPFGLSCFNIAQSVIFFAMFGNFYLQSYKKKSDAAKSFSNGVTTKIPVDIKKTI